MTHSRLKRSTLTAMLATATMLSVAGCASAGEDAAGTPSEGVAYGATEEEYQAAFADVDPVTLKFQMSGPEGDAANEGKEAYVAAVEEWSDGKITFEVGYSNSFVPSALDWADGLADGRVDMMYFIPYLTPEVFPALSQLANATFLDGNVPTSTLVSTAWLTEVAQSIPEYQEEAEAAGVHLLVAPPTFNVAGYLCPEAKTSLDDFAGVQMSGSGTGQFAQIEALGATPVSMAFTELYEALERGVVDCTAISTSVLQTLGAVELVPNLMADPASGLSDFLVYSAISSEVWDSLPLVAQQLLYDRLDVLMQEEPKAQSGRNVKWVEDAVSAGGGVVELDDDARDALATANDQILEDLANAGADTDAFVEAQKKWNETITEDLYSDLPASMEEFLQDGGYTDVDLKPFTDALYEDVLKEYRPS